MKNQPIENSPKPLSVWPSIPIILLCLIGGGWVIHWYVNTAPQPRRSVFSGTTAVEPAKPVVPRNSRGTVTNHQGSWTVRTAAATAEFTLSHGRAALESAVYNSYSFVPEEARSTIKRARDIAGDNDRANRLGISTPQLRQLIGLTTRITMAVSKPDQDLLCAQLQDVAKTPLDRVSLEAKIEQSLEDIAERSIPATRQMAVDRAAQINAIITPQQWQLNNDIISGKVKR